MVSDVKPWRAAILTLLACLIVGPLVGGIVFFGGVSFLPYTRVLYWLDPAFLPATVSATYIYGVVPALLFGATMVIYGWFRGAQPLWVAVLATIVLFILLSLFLAFGNLGVTVVLGLSMLVSSSVCWLFFRRFWLVSK